MVTRFGFHVLFLFIWIYSASGKPSFYPNISKTLIDYIYVRKTVIVILGNCIQRMLTYNACALFFLQAKNIIICVYSSIKHHDNGIVVELKNMVRYGNYILYDRMLEGPVSLCLFFR